MGEPTPDRWQVDAGCGELTGKEFRPAASCCGAYALLKAREASHLTPGNSLVARALRCNPKPRSISRKSARKTGTKRA